MLKILDDPNGVKLTMKNVSVTFMLMLVVWYILKPNKSGMKRRMGGAKLMSRIESVDNFVNEFFLLMITKYLLKDRMTSDMIEEVRKSSRGR